MIEVARVSAQAHVCAADVKARKRRASAKTRCLQTRVDAEYAHYKLALKYQRTEWKKTGAAKHSTAIRSSNPMAPVMELLLPQ